MLKHLRLGSRRDLVAAAIVGVIFAALLGALSYRIWRAPPTENAAFPRWRIITAACLFSLASLACLLVSVVAVCRLRGSPPEGQDDSPPARREARYGDLGRPFKLSVAMQLVLLFLASMVLDCGLFFRGCLVAFVLWDLCLVVVRRHVRNRDGALFTVFAMLGPALLFALLWWSANN